MKYCSNCGAPVEEGSKFCPSCGTAYMEGTNAAETNNNPYEQYNQYNQYNQQYTKPASAGGMAVASLVLGICGIIFGWFILMIPGILAIIFGAVGIKQANSGTKGGKGLAIAGLVMGIIGVVIYFIVLIWAMTVAAYYVPWVYSFM